MNVDRSTMETSNVMYCKSQLSCEFAYRNLKIQHGYFWFIHHFFAHVTHGFTSLTISLIILTCVYMYIVGLHYKIKSHKEVIVFIMTNG